MRAPNHIPPRKCCLPLDWISNEFMWFYDSILRNTINFWYIQHSRKYTIPKNWMKARFPWWHPTYNAVPWFCYIDQSQATCGLHVTKAMTSLLFRLRLKPWFALFFLLHPASSLIHSLHYFSFLKFSPLLLPIIMSLFLTVLLTC